LTTIDDLVGDELWEVIEPLLPPEPPKPKGGRPRVPARVSLSGIGIPGELSLPARRSGRGAMARNENYHAFLDDSLTTTHANNGEHLRWEIGKGQLIYAVLRYMTNGGARIGSDF
jgi:hypothetical protein